MFAVEMVANRDELERRQRAKLREMIEAVRAGNAFYGEKLKRIDFDPLRDSLAALPYTTRAEVQQDQADHGPFGTNLTFAAGAYTRVHQTSGTNGRPLRWLDTDESWGWWKSGWRTIYAAAGVRAGDRIFFPFSFGPFIGFWSAFEAAEGLGVLRIPGGGMSSSARAAAIFELGGTVLCCTPTYALHLAEVAEREGRDARGSTVRLIIVAGEPGGNVPATRAAIETAWGARVIDHAGMTEIGPWGFEHLDAPGGIFVNEAEFIAEVIDPQTLTPLDLGRAALPATGELVLTNLGRIGSPLIRYRTGDIVTLRESPLPAVCGYRWAAGGVCGRVDDMLVIRGNNVFPSAIENIVREFAGVAEYRIRIVEESSLRELAIELEPAERAAGPALAAGIEGAIRDRLHFRPRITLVDPGALPRFELKAKRVVRD